ncbi:MAG: hypothetical protein OEQ53_05945 [Saprospiraceae bacterium]|nr:hypothetical protein [Saprospiraceae bacterium]
MTYIVGWMNERSVFICGDSLLSYRGDPGFISDPFTSFDEILIQSLDERYVESCLKIFNYHGKLLVGFATNDVNEAVEFLEDPE